LVILPESQNKITSLKTDHKRMLKNEQIETILTVWHDKRA